MNEKEISEIRRRFRFEKNNMSRIRGCYVNEKKEIISEFNQSFGLMAQDESESILNVLKKTLSGAIGKNLLDIEFSNQQVLNGEEHKLLMTLRNSSLNDDDSVNELYRRITENFNIDGNYIIVLAVDTYDVPSYSKNGDKFEDSTGIFSYIICSICPIKNTKPSLSYYVHENKLHNIAADGIVSSPELGFMFPTFDERRANIYNALYYTRDISENHLEFVDAIFKTELFMSATLQKETFQSILAETVSEDCSLDVATAVRDEFCEMIEEHKANKYEEPLFVSKNIVREVLHSCGVSEQRICNFEQKYDTEFGKNTVLPPQNIVDSKQFEVSTPDVSIKINPDKSDLVKTKIIDGVKYILIRADEGVEVNGVNIHIS